MSSFAFCKPIEGIQGIQWGGGVRVGVGLGLG